MALLTYDELKREPCWGEQIVPPSMKTLRSALEKHWGVDKVVIGMMGDNHHLKGYHRSRRWIKESKHCLSRTYSVTETQGNRTGGDDDWISAVDLVIGQARTFSVVHALNLAKSHGDIPYVRQILAERAPWHVHISLDRAHANDDHDQLFRVITGKYAARERMVKVTLELPLLRKGSTGTWVNTAQSLLCARGHATKVDGDFGDDTDAQTRAMQKRFGAEKIDAVWGPETWTIAVTGADKR